MNLDLFTKNDFASAILNLFKEQLNVPVKTISNTPEKAKNILKQNYKEIETFQLIDEVYTIGIVDDATFEGRDSIEINHIDKDYAGILIFGVTLKKRANQMLPTRGQLAEITRAFNRQFFFTPVVVLFKYDQYLALANSERLTYKQSWREGEKVGKVSMLKDIKIQNTHSAHLNIIFGNPSKKTSGLQIDSNKINSFEKIYQYWQKQFSIQTLNNDFYADLQDWFYYASQNIILPFKPDYYNEKENIKNFLVRLLARTMFCWFVKEKGLINKELLELTDWQDNRFKLTNDIEDSNFLNSNSYYRGILQNIFFNALNQKEKKTVKDFNWSNYWHQDLKLEWLTEIPYLNGGIFDKLEEDNAKESIEDTVIKIPNYLFYGITTPTQIIEGKGAKATTTKQNVVHKGLNGILKSYKFTLDENTPFEEDIALDPEMLGLVFENLLAELDPNLEESTIKSIRNLTGSYYTPRKIIYEMVNDSLNIYINKYLQNNYPQIAEIPEKVADLVYKNNFTDEKQFNEAVVDALDQYKFLDPACGSGAFPLVALHRITDLLKLVDENNEKWIELKLKKVDQQNRAEFKKVLSKHLDDYGRKLGIIRDSIYGIDIQPMAVQITKLRFFISLLIDQNPDKEITPMPNIESKIICADSLKNIQADLFSQHAVESLKEARNRYYQPNNSKEDKDNIADEIVEILSDAFPTFATKIVGKEANVRNKALLKDWFEHGNIAAPFFNLDFFFPEITEHGGFDCVMGNPPYGGFKIDDEIRQNLDLVSKDPYGAFIARFLNSGDRHQTPLKDGGVLSYIVSDTFMTIKSHFNLRKHLMTHAVHKMLRVHPDTFRATVNTAVILIEKLPKEQKPEEQITLMADLTNLSIHDNYDEFTKVLGKTRGTDFTLQNNISNPLYAIYYYPQKLISTNSNLPFFVASPKLFAFMNDSGSQLKKELRTIGDKQVLVRKIIINKNEIEVVKLGDIAEVKVGLQTGDNNAYLYQNPDARGTYRSIEEYKEFLLTEEDLDQIRNNDKLRLDVIENGISKDNKSSKRYFGGRYIIPYDKGGESDSEEGWLPNYFVATNYFIDWSEWAVKRMKTLTTEERNKLEGKSGGNNKLCSRFQNAESYFTVAIDCSRVGVYSPTYRIATDTVFDSGCNDIYIQKNSREHNLAILTSKFWKFQFISFVNHTVNSQTNDNDEVNLILKINDNLISKKVNEIIKNQKSNSNYDYASHEQIEIDKLIYAAYGLNKEDIQEVENWYARRYPKLSAAQKSNLRALGKSDDYLELYGMK